MHQGLHFAHIPDVQHVGSPGTKLDMLHMAQLYAQAMHSLSSSGVRAWQPSDACAAVGQVARQALSIVWAACQLVTRKCIQQVDCKSPPSGHGRAPLQAARSRSQTGCARGCKPALDGKYTFTITCQIIRSQ